MYDCCQWAPTKVSRHLSVSNLEPMAHVSTGAISLEPREFKRGESLGVWVPVGHSSKDMRLIPVYVHYNSNGT